MTHHCIFYIRSTVRYTYFTYLLKLCGALILIVLILNPVPKWIVLSLADVYVCVYACMHYVCKRA